MLNIRLISLLTEIITIFIPIVLLVNSVQEKSSKTIRVSLIFILALNPQIASMSLLTVGVPHLLFIGSLLTCLWLTLEDQLEFSGVFFGLAFGLNHLAIWVSPIYSILILYKMFSRSMQNSGSRMDFASLSGTFNQISTIGMLFLLTGATPWV